MNKSVERQFRKGMASIIEDALARDIPPREHSSFTTELDDWITQARRFSRPKVVEAGWSDEDIDRIIEEERRAVRKNK